MLLVNQKQITDYPKTGPIYKEYEADLKDIQDTYEGRDFVIVKVRQVPPPDSQGNVYETPPFCFPLISEAQSPNGGSNTWAYCKGHPELQPNGLWKPPLKNRILEKGTMVVDLKNDIDFAVYLFKKSKVFTQGFLEVDDPGREARKYGEEKRRNLLIDSIVWSEIDDDELPEVCAAWGLSGTSTKESDMLRRELEQLLVSREKAIAKGKNVQGVREFMKMRKNKNSIRLRSIVQMAISNDIVKYDKTDRKYTIGDADLISVPVREADRAFDYLCSKLEKEQDELVKLLNEVVDEAYIDSISDKQGDLQWLVNQLGIGFQGKSKEELTKELKDAFCA